MRAYITAAVLAAACAGCAPHEASPEEAKRGRADYELALDAFKRGSYREALGEVESSLKHDDGSADSAYLGAMIMLVFCAGDETSPDCRYAQAEDFARKALAADPDMRDAKNALGVILVHRGKPAQAIAVLEPLAQDMLYRSPEKAWGNLGWAYLEAGRVTEAIGALERSVAAQPLFCVGHYRLGLAYEKNKEYAAARQAFSRALGITESGCSRLQGALLARARVNRHLGQLAEAHKDLEQCREVAAETPTGRECTASLKRHN